MNGQFLLMRRLLNLPKESRKIYPITLPRRAGALIRTLDTVCLCTVWLGNRVEAMELPGQLQTQEDIADSHISDSGLVFLNLSFKNKFLVITALCIS